VRRHRDRSRHDLHRVRPVCRDELLRASEIEAMEIEPSSGIDFASDLLIPAPTD
jgi:hypothetical protein